MKKSLKKSGKSLKGDFEFHPEAEIEFNEAIDYYERIEAGLGYDFAIEVYNTIERSVSFDPVFSNS